MHLIQLFTLAAAITLVGWLLASVLTGPALSFASRFRYVIGNLAAENGELLLKSRTDDLEQQKTELLKAARDIAAKAESEGRDFTDDERAIVTKSIEDARDVQNRILEAKGDAKLVDELNALGTPTGQLAKGGGIDPGRGKSLGERFAGADEFQGWLKSVAPNGEIPKSAGILNSPAVAFRGVKDLLTGADPESAGALVSPQWLGLQDTGTFQRPLALRDLITVGQTDGDAVEYARVTGFTNNAAPVPEAVTDEAIGSGDPAVTDEQGGVKPKSSMTLEKVTANVKTIAHWLPATKRALSDAAQIRTLVDNFLRYGLEEELEDQVATGDGTGENFEGILSVPGTQAQAWDTNLLVTTRKAKTKVRTVGRARASAYVFNPEDNERIDLLRTEEGGANTGSFMFGGPGAAGGGTLWGLPRIESEAVPAGTGIVADWRMAVLWDREQAAIQVSNSHSDFFVRNLVAILAEMRAAFGVIRPPAFVIVDLTA